MRRVILVFGKAGSGKTTFAKRVRALYSRTMTLDPLHEYDGTVFTSYAELKEWFIAKPRYHFDVVLRPTNDEDVEKFFRLAWSTQDVLFHMEEAELFIDNKDRKKNAFYHLVQYGRHKNVDILAVGRRPAELNIYLRAQLTSFFTYVQEEPRDLQRLESWGFDADEVLELEKYKYLVKGEDFHEIASKVEI